MTTKNSDIAIAGKQKTISIIRTFDLPLSTLWKAWTEENNFKKWWAPKDFTCPYCNIDLRIGGKNVSCMRAPAGTAYWSVGEYREIKPLKKIVYDDSFSDSNGNAVPASYYKMPGEWPLKLRVTVTFEKVDGETKMTMEQEGIPEEAYDDCITGWEESFDKLENNFNY